MTRIGIINLVLEFLFACLLVFVFPFGMDIKIKLVILYLITQLMIGRYRSKALLLWDEIRLLIESNLGFFVISFLVFPFGDFGLIEILEIAAMTVILFGFGVFCNRWTRIYLRPWIKHNAVVIGVGKTAQALGSVCRLNRFAMTDVRAYINCNDDPFFENVHQRIVLTGEKETVYPLSQLEEVIQKENVDTVLMAIPEMEKNDIKNLYNRVVDQVQYVKYLPRIEGLVTFDTKVEDFDGILVNSTSQGTIRILSSVCKRIMDFLGAIAGMILLVPLTIYVYRKNRSEGDTDPIFFKQKRIGKNGKEFTIYKFRTMVPNAENVLKELMAKDPKIKAEYEKNKKLVDDPRITKAGKMLREKSLDEFPQFINVLKGEMSLVGPRPYLPGEKEDMGRYYKSVINCKPGLTGMWQTHGRSDVSFDERLELDDYYYRNWNFWLDVTLFVKTIKQVIHGSGAM